jgi:hypothetical protein
MTSDTRIAASLRVSLIALSECRHITTKAMAYLPKFIERLNYGAGALMVS